VDCCKIGAASICRETYVLAHKTLIFPLRIIVIDFVKNINDHANLFIAFYAIYSFIT